MVPVRPRITDYYGVTLPQAHPHPVGEVPGGRTHAYDVSGSVGRIDFSPADAPLIRLVDDRLGEGSSALDGVNERVRRAHHLSTKYRSGGRGTAGPAGGALFAHVEAL